MTRKMFYDLLLAAFLGVAAYAVITSLSGCGSSSYKGIGEYHADPNLKTRDQIRAEARDKQYGPAYEKFSMPEPDHTKELEAKIDSLQAQLSQFIAFQTYHTQTIAQDRANDLAVEACFKKCDKPLGKLKWDETTEQEKLDHAACQEKCQRMPHTPTGMGC